MWLWLLFQRARRPLLFGLPEVSPLVAKAAMQPKFSPTRRPSFSQDLSGMSGVRTTYQVSLIVLIAECCVRVLSVPCRFQVSS